jgi:hypothetical protein
MKNSILLFIILFANINVFAQNVAINSDGSSPDASAVLDITATDKGLLLPRVVLSEISDASPITTPANSLLIYNTATVNDVTPGYYYWNDTNSEWVRLITEAGSGSTATHYVGEFYAGGIVFYVDQTGEHGLVVSIDDIDYDEMWASYGPVNWHDNLNDNEGAISYYDGSYNTSKMMDHSDGNDNSAAENCYFYDAGGFDDWYLPAISQLRRLYNEADIVSEACLLNGGSIFTIASLSPEGRYWSSTQVPGDTGKAYCLTFQDGITIENGKSWPSRVRAIRNF